LTTIEEINAAFEMKTSIEKSNRRNCSNANANVRNWIL